MKDAAINLLTNPVVWAVLAGAVSGAWGAFDADLKAYHAWKKDHPTLAYDWRLARTRVLHGAIRGVAGALGIGGAVAGAISAAS